MRHRWVLRISSLLLLALLYFGLTQKYRAYDVDNSWFLSFSYNACHEGIQTDVFEGFRFPKGMDGVHLFGKLAAGLQCSFMNQVGWTPKTIVWLNVTFGIASLVLWWSFLVRSGHRETWVAAFILLFGASEPMVSMMERGRYEFFAFFLLSLALWLGVQGLELMAIAAALLAVETEPAAIIVPAVVGLLLFLRTNNRRLLALKIGIAAVAAMVFYVELHPGAIREMSNASASLQKPQWAGTMISYFVERRRHLPELLLLLIGASLYTRHVSEIPDRTAAWLALLVGFFLLLGLHPNPAYVVFAMPFLLWLALLGYQHAKSYWWIPVLFFFFFLMQYVYLFRINLHEGFDYWDFSAVRQRIDDFADRSHIPTDQIRIAGDYSMWFSHPQNYRAIESAGALQHADLYLCFDHALQKNGLSSSASIWCNDLRSDAVVRELSSVEVKGHLLHLFAPQR